MFFLELLTNVSGKPHETRWDFQASLSDGLITSHTPPAEDSLPPHLVWDMRWSSWGTQLCSYISPRCRMEVQRAH